MLCMCPIYVGHMGHLGHMQKGQQESISCDKTTKRRIKRKNLPDKTIFISFAICFFLYFFRLYELRKYIITFADLDPARCSG